MIHIMNDATFRWIVGGLLGLISSIGAFWMSYINQRIDMISDSSIMSTNRISVLEANVDGFNKRLDRIETKIDFLIQEKTREK
jgi:hypothetical protein